MINIIAEIGSVHDGSFGNALRLIDAAAAAGADTVKFQTHLAEAESLTDAPSPSYFRDESRIEYFTRTGFSPSQWKRLANRAEEQKVNFLSSPFSLEAVDLLEEVGVKAYKVPSGEVSNVPLLERLAATGKPVIVSSGVSNWAELDRAVDVLKADVQLSVMQCSSAYPCPAARVGLNVIAEMRERYGLPVGFSDHTLGFAAPFAAAALGAEMIEKHFTFSRLMYGSDAQHSMEPDDFKILCSGLREIWSMLAAPVNKADNSEYAAMKSIFEKSIVASRQIAEGTILERSMLAFKKPGNGIPARDYESLVGRRLRASVPPNHKFSPEDFQ